MPFRWQYPSLVEPVSTSPETTTVDRYQGNAPSLLPVKRVLSAAILAGSLFFVPVVTTTETVTVDKWFQPASQPTYRIRQTPGSYTVDPTALTTPETVTADRWRGSYPDRIDRKQFHASQQQALAFVKVPDPETVTLDKWYSPPSQPYLVARQPVQRGWWTTDMTTPVVPFTGQLAIRSVQDDLRFKSLPDDLQFRTVKDDMRGKNLG